MSNENRKRLKRWAAASLMLAAGLLLTPTWAQASCVTNKAICQAICGSDCCDSWSGGTLNNRGAVETMNKADLIAEVGRAKQGSSFEQALQAEVDRRSQVGVSPPNGVPPSVGASPPNTTPNAVGRSTSEAIMKKTVQPLRQGQGQR